MLLGVALNCENRFTITGTAPLAIPAVTLIALWGGQGRIGIYALAAGTLAGYVIEFAILVYACLKGGLLRGAKFKPSARDLVWLARLASPLVMSAAVLGLSSIIDQALAATLAPGSVSALSYGNKLVSLFVTVAVTSLSTTAFPTFSRMVALGDWSAVRATLRTFVGLILALTVPLTVALAVGNEWIVRTLFERGSFTAQTTAIVAPVQLGYLLQIPFYTVGVFGVRLLMSMGGNTTVLKIAICSLTVNVAGDLILMQYFGVAGIAAATSLVYLGASIMILTAVYRRLASMERRASIPRPHFAANADRRR
jgi:putative peptidoglycan lipid II flippase